MTMATPFVSVLIDDVAIDDKWVSLDLRRRDEEATDVLTLELADNSLQSLFDFNTVPLTTQIQVATRLGPPETDGSTVSTTDLTSLGSDFVALGATLDDVVKVIASSVPADIGTFPIVGITTNVLTTSHLFGTASGIVFIVLRNQGKFFAEKPDVLEDANMVTVPSIWGRCNLARLQDPFALKITRTYLDKTTMQTIVKDLVEEAGMDPSLVVFGIDDYTVPGGLLRVVDQYPLQIIIDLVTRTNGYVRCDKVGNLIVKKRFFHFDAVASVKAIGDDNLQGDMQEALDFPEFGNRILIRSSIPSSGQAVQVQIRSATPCLRGDSFSQMEVLGIVRDDEGKAVPDGVLVDFTIDNPALAAFAATPRATGQRTIIGEVAQASSLTSVSVDFPIVAVIGVFLESDPQKLDNLFTGGSFGGSRITLGSDTPFTDSTVVVDYVAGGIAVALLIAVDGAPEANTTIRAAVGKVRSSTSFCISNRRNGSIRLSATPTEHNICVLASRVSEIQAKVIVDGLPASGAMIRWNVAGIGSISPRFSLVRNAVIENEIGKPRSVFVVPTKNTIVSVRGVFLLATGKLGTNYFLNNQDRQSSFKDNLITLGTDLPALNLSVIIEYVAASLALANYNAPEQVGAATVIATLNTGQERGLESTININVVNRCQPLQEGGPKNPPGADRDCGKSVPSARACADQPTQGTRVECICAAEGRPDGCPEGEECEEFCREMYNKHGLDPLACETLPTAEEVSDLQVAYGVLIPSNQRRAYKACDQECAGDPDCVDICVPGHRDATIERCAKTCEDHGVQISPVEAELDCQEIAPTQDFAVKGGTPPYTWSSTNGSMQVSEDGLSATLSIDASKFTGADNARAYLRQVSVAGCGHTGTGGSEAHAQVPNTGIYACNPSVTFPEGQLGYSTLFSGVNVQALFGGNTVTSCAPPDVCANHLGHCGGSDPADCVPNSTIGIGGATINCAIIAFEDLSVGSNLEARIDAHGAVTDVRTPAMIAQGCKPCTLNMANTVVTVKDSLGNEAMATVDAVNRTGF